MQSAARKKGVFDALIAAAQRLLLVAQSCRERPSRDLTRFTAQIQALIDGGRNKSKYYNACRTDIKKKHSILGGISAAPPGFLRSMC